MQKLVYFRMINIRFPQNVRVVFKIFGSVWSMKKGATDYEPDAEQSKLDILLGVNQTDQNPPDKFKELQFSDLYTNF